jgi:hypothetical protein
LSSYRNFVNLTKNDAKKKARRLSKMPPKHYQTIEGLNACTDGLEWLESQGEDWYDQCNRGDWLIWLVAKLCDRKTVVLCACDCAEQVLQYVPEGEDRPRIAIETARRWCRGEATIDEVSHAAAGYAADYVADRAARVADYVADRAAREAGYAAVYAASAAAYAAYAAGDASRQSSFRLSSDLVRSRVPWSVMKKLLNSKKKETK